MKKINSNFSGCRRFAHLALSLAMVLLLGNHALAQGQTISVRFSNSALEQVLDGIEKQSNYRFMYNPGDIDVKQKVSIEAIQKSLDEVLGMLFNTRGISYQISGQQIVLSPKDGARTVPTATTPSTTTTTAQPGASTNQPSATQQPQASRSVAGVPITGVVSDAITNELIQGAAVQIVRSNGTPGMGVITNIKGEFTINSPTPATDRLVISYVGYKNSSTPIGSQRNLIIKLQSDVQNINEVVVTGYQTISKERATGSFAILNKEAINKTINLNATQALDGQAAGVSTYGDKVIIRGISTMSGSIGNTPLLVIDGLPTERKLDDINMNDVESITVLKDAAASSIYGVRAANGVIVITTKRAALGKTNVQFTADWQWKQNPSLSDYHYASTSDFMNYELTSIARGAAKVSLTELAELTQNLRGIGEAGSSSSSLGYYSPLRYARLQVLNGSITQDAYDQLLAGWRKTDYRKEYMDLVWKTPLRQSYNLAVSSGSDRQNTYASLNYTKEGLQVLNNENQYIKGYIKSNQQITKWLNFELGADVQYVNKEYVDTQYSSMTTLEPYTQILDNDGNRIYRDYVNVNGGGDSQLYTGSLYINPKILGQIAGLPATQFMPYTFNILDELGDNRNSEHNYSLRSFVKLKVNIAKGLTYTPSFDYEFGKNRTETMMTKNSYYMRFLRNRYSTSATTNSTIPSGGHLGVMDKSTNSYVFRNQVDYNTLICRDHEITATAGIELKQLTSQTPNYMSLYGYDPQGLSHTTLNTNTITSIGLRTSYIYNNATGKPGAVVDGSYLTLNDRYLKPTLTDGDIYMHRFVGIYAVGGYTYKGRYGVSGSFRIDQADLFGSDPKYRYRPLWSVGVKWNAAKEDFMSSVTWIDMLDLRASYGLTGNVDQSTSPFLIANASTQVYYTAETIPFNFITTTGAPNPLLRWERTTTYNVGLDFALLSGKLNGKLDYYFKKSDDLLANIDVHFTSGYTSMRVNYGEMTNKGFELTLSSPWYRTQDWLVTSTLMFSYNKNAVTKAFYAPSQAAQLFGSAKYYIQGDPYNSVYAYNYGGLTSDGTVDQNGVPIIYRADGTTVHHYNANGSLSLDQPTSMQAQDVTYMGSGIPVFNASFSQGVKFKNFELNAMLIYYGGHKVFKPSFQFYQNSVTNTLPDWVGKAWTPDNTSSLIPKSSLYYDKGVDPNVIQSLSEMYRRSTNNVVKGDFIRLRNLALSYYLPEKYANKIGLQRIKVTGQANNLWYWSAAGKGIDPETLNGNSGDWTLPSATTYLLRVDVLF